MRFPILSLIAFAASALTAPVELEERQSATVCGSTSYTASQVSAAARQAYSYYANDQQVGSNDYPHTYNNYEGFDFVVSGPYQEFPLLRSGVYTGGSPGADRVVINTRGQYGGAITHTGASGNKFVGCSGTS